MAYRRARVCGAAILFVVLVAACASSRSDTIPTGSTFSSPVSFATTTTTLPGAEPSAGCVRAAAVEPVVGEHAAGVTIDGVQHRYFLSVPAAHSPTEPAPLVLLFHGFGS